MKLHVEPALKKALRVCAEELDQLGADWAIAGATAMRAHGYTRATRDVDIFVGDDVRGELLTRLRNRGAAAKPIFQPHHYRITPRGSKDPEAAIDLLFPSLGVESLGLLAATRTPIEGVAMPVLPIHHIIALKLTTDPNIDASRYVRDAADLIALRDRGLVDPTRVGVILDDVDDPDARRRLTKLVSGSLLATVDKPAKRRRR